MSKDHIVPTSWVLTVLQLLLNGATVFTIVQAKFYDYSPGNVSKHLILDPDYEV
jgi:hypothetical protein